MKAHKLIAPVIGSAILGTAVVLAAWPEDSGTTESNAQSGRPVVVAAVENSPATYTLRLSGLTRAAERAQLSFSIPARLAGRPVDIGDRVSRGQLLATLDDREFRLARQAAMAALAELESRLAQARRDLDRVERLAEAEAATDEEVEQTGAAVAALEAARDAAGAGLSETERLLDESALRAPFDGTVTAVHLEPGEWASPGRAVLELAGEDEVEVMVEAPESVRGRLAEGQAVTVELPFAGLEVPARVTGVAAASAGPGRLFPVVVALDPTFDAVPGLAAEVVLPLTTEPELTVPLRSVLNPGSSRPAVFRIADGRADRIPVQLGRVIGDRITVEAALTVGDRIAISGHTALADGDQVEVH